MASVSFNVIDEVLYINIDGTLYETGVTPTTNPELIPTPVVPSPSSSNVCQVTPVSAFLSTNLNNKLETYQQLGDRVKRSLGWPLISIELHSDQLNENIQIAVELFTKFAGYTQEFLVFDSNLYEKNKGIRLDHLFTVANSEYTTAQKVADIPPTTSVGVQYETPVNVYIALQPILSSVFSASSSLSTIFTKGIEAFDIFDKETYTSIITFNSSLSSSFLSSRRKVLNLQNQPTQVSTFNNAFDYDVLDYRKVIDVVDFEEGSTTGINTLFTLEQTLAQQTYFSYAMGNYGFDLISWYTMKEFMDTREKLLAIRRDIHFDPRTQYLTMYPQPKEGIRFYGVISCHVERPIRDIVKEPWVYQYALALSKITVGRVRSKFTGVNLLGGGSINYDLLEEGRTEKAELERRLFEGASPGFGDAPPTTFFIG